MAAPSSLRCPVRRRLVVDARGTTILEFGLILPVLCIMLLGAFDFGHSLYMQSLLQGAVQKAARDSSLESGAETSVQATIDDQVKEQLLKLHKSATVSFDRRFYRTFSEAAAAQAESFTDSTTAPFNDGICNNNEPYVDENNNNVWDQDGGDVGQGGARDNVVYTVTISYPRVFPIDQFIGGSGTTTLSATTVLSNQPYGNQASYGAPTVRQCS